MKTKEKGEKSNCFFETFFSLHDLEYKVRSKKRGFCIDFAHCKCSGKNMY